jgi:DNA-binding response OmpR family regulator
VNAAGAIEGGRIDDGPQFRAIDCLVVEDDPWIRLLMRDLLTDEEYAVLEASNGWSAALRLAERHPPALVLLDLVLPEPSGLDLLTVLKSMRATAHVPIIAVTARTDLLARSWSGLPATVLKEATRVMPTYG